jgi:hypothetical protein
MKPLSHGALLLDNTELTPPPAIPGLKVVACKKTTRFDYLFRDLPKSSKDYLPDTDATGAPMAQTLINLGNSMTDPDSDGDPPVVPPIPSAYTYFGQFITHEIVFEVTFKDRKLGPDTAPLGPQEIAKLQNARTTLMDLDSLYGPMLDNHGVCYEVPRKGDLIKLGIAGNGDTFRGFDLKRELDPPFTAEIGDRRNDSNLILSQMHLAFLRAHNELIDRGKTFSEAQKILDQHFQWLVVYDYLRRVVNNEVLDLILDGTIDLFKSFKDDPPFMPLEFSAAAFRFAHSLPKSHYNYNASHTRVELKELFLPIPRYSRIAEEWMIDWNRFVPVPGPDGNVAGRNGNVARPIDTRLVQSLFELKDSDGNPVVDSTGEKKLISLSSLDLLRGYLLHLPTGQAVARELG